MVDERLLNLEVNTRFEGRIEELEEPMEIHIKLVDETDEVLGTAVLEYIQGSWGYNNILVFADNKNADGEIIVTGLRKEISANWDCAIIILERLEIVGGYRQKLGTKFLKLIEDYLRDIYAEVFIGLYVHPITKDKKKLNKDLTQKDLAKFYKNLDYYITKRKVGAKTYTLAYKRLSEEDTYID